MFPELAVAMHCRQVVPFVAPLPGVEEKGPASRSWVTVQEEHLLGVGRSSLRHGM